MMLSSYRSTLVLSPSQWCVRALWVCLFQPIARASLSARVGLSTLLLRVCGASVGKGVVIKGGVRVTLPWNLTIGDYTWIGESVWLDSLDRIEIGSHVCISQGSYLCTGSHDRTSEQFDLLLRPIRIEDRVWIGAFCILAPGTVMMRGSIGEMGVRIRGVIEADAIVCSSWGEEKKRRTTGPRFGDLG